MKPPFPTDYDELIKDLHTRGSYSFELKKVNKRAFKMAVDRTNKSVKLTRTAKTKIDMLKVLLFNTYVELLHDFLFCNDKGVKWAIIYYRTALPHISTIGGEDVNDTLCRVTFNART